MRVIAAFTFGHEAFVRCLFFPQKEREKEKKMSWKRDFKGRHGSLSGGVSFQI